MQGYRVTTDQSEMDFSVIFDFISQSYWAKGIPQATMHKAIDNAFCFAVLQDNGEQVGFARLITDKATFAYLAGVFILPQHRGQGLSKWLMENIIAHPELQGLRRMILATRDAHGLYKQFGFTPIEPVENFMQIWQPNVYQG
ncbi:GNAT family N-acetyltransferase [Vibrio vulnificus]|uniref:GNAT family N-acetyltransferase n=1 Tax=Vibrio vulnificus TaxID=672 RepID=UPI001CDD1D3F|nr:GNAT family N-acetyltransferase [Vibrio vulnificus]ELV8708044.1 GNAT family N-acetyltransferase [Vibrio vulnificus]MCA3980365.1 GNAT family N-acetyltransferase [Vibrio vulnificus]MCR9498615.1 GNAT family N-acetyltransferase [Vibrio vulnificus]MCU8389955.1 GNAT family N-acetyltransferase [Vibrio vulnificus]